MPGASGAGFKVIVNELGVTPDVVPESEIQLWLVEAVYAICVDGAAEEERATVYGVIAAVRTELTAILLSVEFKTGCAAAGNAHRRAKTTVMIFTQ